MKILSFVTPNVEQLNDWLTEHGSPLFVSSIFDVVDHDPDVVVIPSMNAFSFLNGAVIGGNQNKTIHVNGVAQNISRFFKLLYEQSIPVVALGQSATILWQYFGGKLEVSPEHKTLMGMMGEVNPEFDWPNCSMYDRNKHDFKYKIPFYQTVEVDRVFRLADRPHVLYPLGWETGMTKSVFHSKTSGQHTLNKSWEKQKGNIAAFAHISNLFFGLAYKPEVIVNRDQSLMFRRYGYERGDKLANRIMLHLSEKNNKDEKSDDPDAPTALIG